RAFKASRNSKMRGGIQDAPDAFLDKFIEEIYYTFKPDGF
ncbi:MAG: hypothetical protein QG610_1, partial [Euryarchaeota archaeon]|nr:hypothetical protein [Euryarchaeota archaeon]